MYPQCRLVLDAHANAGAITQFVTQLVDENACVGPVHLATWQNVLVNQLQPGQLLDVGTRRQIAGPVGTHQHGGAVAVLPVDQQILVAQQVQHGQHLGEQGDQQYQQQGSGKKTAWQQRMPTGPALHADLPSGTNT